MEFTHITLITTDNIAKLILDSPEKGNALNEKLIKDLTDAFVHISKNENIKAVILTGSGEAFCTGVDFDYLRQVANYSLEENQEDSRRLLRLYQCIYELRKPVVAMVNGPALAFGCGLATVCDFIFASEQNSKFGYPEVGIGFLPAIVLVYLVKRIGEGRARELVLTGKTITAKEALRIGLINEAVKHNDLENYTLNFVKDLIKKNSTTAMGLCKEMFTVFGMMDIKQTLDYAGKLNAFARMTPEFKKYINSLLNKEEIKW